MLDDELGAGQRRCFLGDGVGFGGFLELGQQLARHLLGFETLLSVREALPELDDAVQLLAHVLCIRRRQIAVHFHAVRHGHSSGKRDHRLETGLQPYQQGGLMDRLIEAIEAKQNPSVAGLNPTSHDTS